MEARTNMTNIFKLPVKYDMIVETNWNNNSKPASKTPSRTPSIKPSSKHGGSSRSGKSSSKPGVAASKSGSASRPVAGGASRPAVGTPSRLASGKSSRPTSGKSSRPVAGTSSRPAAEISSRSTSRVAVTKHPSKSASGSSLKSIGETSPEIKLQESTTPKTPVTKSPDSEKAVSEQKLPSAIPGDPATVKSKESEKPKEKRTEENLNEEDQERRLTFCRTKQKKSIVLSECAPQATAYLLAVEKVFKEKDFASERNIRSTCAGNCQKMLVPKEVPPEKKKSDEFAKRLTSAGNCGNTGKGKENMN